MKTISIPGTCLFAAVMLFLFSSCEKEIKNDSASELVSSNTFTAEAALESPLLKAVRKATSRFNSTTLAQNAGYTPNDHCVSVPGLGGMGFHWANFNLVDPLFEPLKPEVMLYAEGPGGNLRLVAVEYVVIDIGQPRPSFDGQLFDIGGAPVPVPHWTLHVWLHEINPSGIFTPFNPNISCH